MDIIQIKLKSYMTRIFKLKLDTQRTGDPEYDAVQINLKEFNNVPFYFLDPNTYSIDRIPKLLYYDANFEYIPKYDFPFTDSGIFTVSKKVKEVLYQFVEFKFYEVPVVMLDNTFLEKRFDDEGTLNQSITVNLDYVALRFPELKSYFDFDKSIYRIPSYNPNGVRGIKKMVLKEPKNGFPIIFRTKESASTVFVSEELKNELENVNVKGCVFEEVEVSPYII